MSDPDAHSAERIAAAAAVELFRCRERKASARHSEWVAKRDRTAIGVHMLAVVGKAKLAKHRQRLRGEGFVDLDYVHVGDREAEPLQKLL